MKPISLVAGAYHSCALLQFGEVMCWGDDSIGQLGDAVMLSLSETEQPRKVRPGTGETKNLDALSIEIEPHQYIPSGSSIEVEP